MDLTIVGCSGSFPGPDSAASCYLVEAEGFRLLLDLGNGALGALQRYCPLDQIDAVCLSHLHADHCLDMCAYQVFRAYNPAGQLPAIPVYAPAGAAARLDKATDMQSAIRMAVIFDFVTLTPGTMEIGPFTVVADHMNHPVETFGFRIEHDGQVLAYSADTGPADQLVRLAAGADLMLCEASFPDAGGLPPDLHLTAREAGEHAARAGAGELILTHLVPWTDREAALTNAAAAYPGTLSLAEAGGVFSLPAHLRAP
ncbi:MAG TPA: MBL fold metallo-hydrolase [Streptosporangiaceae bacterium]|nr:MBL fold metallo-hydrolase [Streptosporangiaceae bacterium]